MLASDSISRWQISSRRGAKEYPTDYQWCRPVALECQIGSDALPPPAAPDANKPAALVRGKLYQVVFTRLVRSERGRVSPMTDRATFELHKKNAKAGMA